jgi:hypothetical protein
LGLGAWFLYECGTKLKITAALLMMCELHLNGENYSIQMQLA